MNRTTGPLSDSTGRRVLIGRPNRSIMPKEGGTGTFFATDQDLALADIFADILESDRGLENLNAMVLGDLISNSELVLDQERFAGLSGRIVHHSLDNEGNTVSGIQWLDLSTITEKRMELVAENLRKKMFKED